MGFDSVDVWAQRKNYLICANDKPKCVAAAVPDKYSDKVQVWGNPIYDWNNMAKDDFAWWRMRIRVNKELFDIVRINHFAGMVKIYTVPYDKKEAATSGKWIKGPGKKLINAIKEELQEFGFIRKRSNKKDKNHTGKSQPLHFVDDNGFHIYVGKNNYQNDQLTFKMASGNDWWFHAKGMPGSHVIVKAEGRELADETFEYAAALAAYYSNGRENDKVEIDYLQRKNIKKPNHAAPGFVVYYTNFSMVASPGILHVTKLDV